MLDTKGFKINELKIEGFKTGVDLENCSDVDFKNMEISSGDSKLLIEKLTEFKIILQENPKDKRKLTDIFDQIYSVCGSVQGISGIIETLSKFLGLG